MLYCTQLKNSRYIFVTWKLKLANDLNTSRLKCKIKVLVRQCVHYTGKILYAVVQWLSLLLDSTNPKLRLYACSNPARGLLKICDSGNLSQ